MKRLLIIAALGLMAVGQVQAQDEQTDESREAKRTELIAKSGERLAKSFSLEGDAKESFLATYAAYQQEMFATNGRRERTAEARQQDGEGKKELTDEQATERIEANLKQACPDTQGHVSPARPPAAGAAAESGRLPPWRFRWTWWSWRLRRSWRLLE